MPKSELYERDFHAWTQEQAGLLQSGNWGALDCENIMEEILSMGRGERRELVNHLVILMLHLLQWQYQPKRRGRSWRLIIKEQHNQVLDHMRDNPSLESQMPGVLEDAYRRCKIKIEKETGLAEQTFPLTCPWTFEHIMDEGFLPEQE